MSEGPMRNFNFEL